MRGKGKATANIKSTTGITPACAGKRHICKRYAMRRRDHPRVCGEKGRKNRFIFSHPGSPPRVRGKGKNTNRMGRTTGITPACAGKRTSFDADMANSGDHPRVCGEKKKMQPRKDKRMGSPPRVRGKAQESFLILCHHGITPACAGKRTVTTKEAFQKQDHPRVCGEKALPASWRLPVLGSPPRVRGKEPW